MLTITFDTTAAPGAAHELVITYTSEIDATNDVATSREIRIPITTLSLPGVLTATDVDGIAATAEQVTLADFQALFRL